MFWLMSEHANTRRHVSERSWLYAWVFWVLSSSSSFSSVLFFYVFECNKYIQLLLIWSNKKKKLQRLKKFGGKWSLLTAFFLTAPSITHWTSHLLFILFDVHPCRSVSWSANWLVCHANSRFWRPSSFLWPRPFFGNSFDNSFLH